jgi:hypothetical protein
VGLQICNWTRRIFSPVPLLLANHRLPYNYRPQGASFTRLSDCHGHLLLLFTIAMVESRQPEVLAIIGLFTVLAFIFVLVRIWSRLLGRNFGWDDHLIVSAMVLLFGQTLATWKCTFTAVKKISETNSRQTYCSAVPATTCGIFPRHQSLNS